ncbi:MAG TPA: FAD binding domain-containing protein [Casimicrobiaceae bacterium]|nr:FAD binding domain-containing protein [Casimicrobiaceae bacterium]
MKAARFLYERPDSLPQALALLDADERITRVLAGGQSLAPMLNLRLATPDMLVDVTRVKELTRAEDDDDAVVLGACVTHASIEDGRVPDPTHGIMRRVAAGIAYRAVRNRGTIGGSLAHADPAADWVVTLAALDAKVLVASTRARRTLTISELVVGPFETALAAGEIIEAIRIAKIARDARFGYCKIARKAGKFADAMAAVLFDRKANIHRMVIGATESRPLVIEGLGDPARTSDLARAASSGDEVVGAQLLERAGLMGDTYFVHLHFVALRRALSEARLQ